MAQSVDINISLIFLWYSWKSATRYCVLLMLRRVRRMFFFEARRSSDEKYEREEISRLISGDWLGRW